MIDRELGEILMTLQRALMEFGLTEEDASELIDELETKIAEALEDTDGEVATEES
jgi:cell fate (sporulation/competence/biofilm development) regulator YlbF (YheA/YmcA/DUF963 family)